jgi:hypothetical protein
LISNIIVITLSSLGLIMFYFFAVSNTGDKPICDYNLCGVQTYAISLVHYVSAAPPGNYTSSPSEKEGDGGNGNNDKQKSEERLQAEPGSPAPYTPPEKDGDRGNPQEPAPSMEAPYTPSEKGKDGSNSGGTKGEQNEEHTTFEHTTFDTPITAVANTTNATGTNATITNATGTNAGMNGILDSLKNIFGGIGGK